VAAEAWDAWLDSRRQGHRVGRTFRRFSPSEEGEPIRSDDEIRPETTVDQYGDPRFLIVFMKALAAIREIAGANEPIRTDGRVDNISEMLARTYEDEKRRLSKDDSDQRQPSDNEKIH
jgi:hypothetical protein